MRECADEAAAYQAEIDDADQDKSLEDMIAAGVTEHEPSYAGQWVACVPMLAEYRGKGVEWNDFIDKILAVQ